MIRYRGRSILEANTTKTMKYKKSNALGFEMYTLDIKAEKRSRTMKRIKQNIRAVFQAIGWAGGKTLDNAIPILGVAMIGTMMYAGVLGFQLLGMTVQAIVGEDPHDAYQMEVVQTAIAEHRATIVHPETGAEMPPYWNVEQPY